MNPGEQQPDGFASTFPVKEEIEILMGLKYRHGLNSGSGKAKRGWKGLGLVEKADLANLKSGSMK